MNGIEMSFPNISCTKCSGTKQMAIMKLNRYGIYCAECSKFIKWADSNQTVVIKSREAWLLQQSKLKLS